MTDTIDVAQPRSVSPTAMAQVTPRGICLDPAQDQDGRALLSRMVRVMFPHARLGEGPYGRTADAILNAACATPAVKVAFATALHDLRTVDFAAMNDADALAYLRTVERTDFFQLTRSTAVVALYDDPELWELFGYEGPSVDKGGYVHRGFDDLDWLPDPRIEEYGGEA